MQSVARSINVLIDTNTTNLLMYIILTSKVLVANASFRIAESFRKTTINSNVVTGAVKIIFPDGDLQDELTNAIRKAVEITSKKS